MHLQVGLPFVNKEVQHTSADYRAEHVACVDIFKCFFFFNFSHIIGTNPRIKKKKINV